MLPVLKAAAAGEIGIRDCVEQLSGEFGLSEDERSELLPSGKQTTFANRVHWARTYLAQAGLVQPTRRAHFKITERGREVLARGPERIDTSSCLDFPSFRTSKLDASPIDRAQ
jgi:restriction system protein